MGAEAVVAYYEWFCSHSDIMNISTLNGSKWMKTDYLKRYCGQTLEITEDVAD
jgi:hypothetical protein